MRKCPRCESDAFYLYGHTKNGKQRYLCLQCNRQFVEGSVEVRQNRPRCPRCGATMNIYKQEDETVRFRCSNYPDCREYIKMEKENVRR